MKVVLALSGGMDSASLLGLLLANGAEVHCCIFSYGSKHNPYENRAAEKIIDYYLEKGFPVIGHRFNLEKVFIDFQSNLLLSGGAIPEGHYNNDNMKLTVVPGRNLIFASIMAGLAESIGAGAIALGVHAGDHHIYPDCRPEFIVSLNHTILQSSDQKVGIWTPLNKDTKATILEKGLALNPPVPYQLTRTCYKDQSLSCGKCGSCQERLEAFTLLGIKDPIQYE